MGRMRNLLLYATVGLDDFRRAWPEAVESNRRSLLVLSTLVALAMLALTAASFFADSLVKNRLIYGACSVISLVIVLITMNKRANTTTVVVAMYLFTGMMYAFGIVLGTVIEPNQVSVSFPILIFAVPLVFVDSPLRMSLATLVGIVVYCVAAVLTQQGYMIEYNLSNIIPYGIVSMLLTSFVMTVKMRQLVGELKLKDAVETDSRQLREITQLNDDLARQVSITGALTKSIQFIYLANLENGTFETVKEQAFIREAMPEQQDIRRAMEQFLAVAVMPGRRDAVAAFCNHETLAERLSERDTVGIEYRGAVNGTWNRISWICSERNAEGTATRALLVVEDVSEETEEFLEFQKKLGAFEKDDTTGAYTRQAFFYHGARLLEGNAEMLFDVVMVQPQDIALLNTTVGPGTADVVMKTLCGTCSDISPLGIIGRFGPYTLVGLVPSQNTDYPQWLEDGLRECAHQVGVSCLEVKCGVYQRVDRSLDLNGMVERAVLAINSILDNREKSVAFFDGAVSQRYLRAMSYTQWFDDSLKNREFVVWYQPKYDPRTEAMVGAEALVRWRRNAETMLSPAEFVGVFEENGLIAALDEYVFRTVCAQQRAWIDAGLEPVPVSVNASRVTLRQDGMADTYRRVIDNYRLDPALVPIEITESAAAIGSKDIKPLAVDLHERGISLHLDDFGSGQSSLGVLSHILFDTVKLDKDLVDAIGDQRGDAILKHAIALAKSLDVAIVAEGVEEASQVEYLCGLGCDAIQGYYYSRPLPPADFEGMLRG